VLIRDECTQKEYYTPDAGFGYLVNKAIINLLLAKNNNWDIEKLKTARSYLDRKIKRVKDSFCD
jgi:hypothetical protein